MNPALILLTALLLLPLAAPRAANAARQPASQLTEAEKNNALYRRNRIRAELPTLIERLKAAGYYQGVTHKLHVAPVEKFPYDEFIAGQDGQAVADFLARANKTGKPWHLFFNISVSHRAVSQ